jgi:hypothetical protein
MSLVEYAKSELVIAGNSPRSTFYQLVVELVTLYEKQYDSNVTEGKPIDIVNLRKAVKQFEKLSPIGKEITDCIPHEKFRHLSIISAFLRITLFKPLTPLTGNDDEWIEVSNDIYQNKRYGSVFKENGKVHDLDGRSLYVPNDCFSSWVSTSGTECKTPVTFPYKVSTDQEKVYFTDHTKQQQLPVTLNAYEWLKLQCDRISLGYDPKNLSRFRSFIHQGVIIPENTVESKLCIIDIFKQCFTGQNGKFNIDNIKFTNYDDLKRYVLVANYDVLSPINIPSSILGVLKSLLVPFTDDNVDWSNYPTVTFPDGVTRTLTQLKVYVPSKNYGKWVETSAMYYTWVGGYYNPSELLIDSLYPVAGDEMEYLYQRRREYGLPLRSK